MIDNIHNDGKDLNDSTIRQFEDYLDVNQNYNNFLPIAEFHDTYEEFPTVYHENVVQEPKKKKEEKKKEQKRESDSSSDNSSGSSDASSSGPTGAESSAGASAGASSSSALADLSASQVLSTTFVTMVAVTAVVVPIIENADLEVDLDVDYNAGILTYMIELINASDGSDYYAVVMEGQTVILQQQIFDNYQSNTITDLRNSQEHRVEVRTGTPPLYVLDSVIIPATPSWAEWGHLTVSYNSIDYGVYFHGDSGEAVLKLTDTNSGEILYTKDLVDGLNSDVIGDLFSSHLYTLTVETETDTLLIKDIQTEYTDISWNHLTVVDNVIDYGVEVNLGGVDVTISLYDPSTSSILYSMDLMQGYNADVIRDLEYNHTYELTVASADETYLFETLTTDSEPIEVTVGHLTPKDNTIDYELIVSGEGKTVTLNIYDAAGGPSVYTASLTSGSNTGIIEGLEYSHSYLLTVSSASKTYLSESVTTEAEPTKVTLDSLTSTETSIQYKVTVTGDRDTVTAYLKDPTSGETLYSKELTVGANTAVIEELEPGYTYQFTVSSKTATYVSKEITTGSHPVEVTLNHLTPSDNTIDYEVTVTGNSEVVTAYLYDAEGEEVYSKVLSEGVNPGIIENLNYDYTYQFTISSETQIYVSEEVTISASIIVESLAADGLIINYEMTLNGTEDATITLYREEGDLEIESAELPAGKTTPGSFKGTGDRPIEPNKEYYIKGYIGEKEYELGSITTELRVVTKELMSDGNFIRFKVEVYESAGSNMYVYIYDSNGEPLIDEELPVEYEIKEDPEIIGDLIGNRPYIPWGDTYTLKAEIDGQTYLIGEVRVVDAPSFEAEGNSIKYRFIMNDFGYSPFLTFDSETGGSADLYLDITSDGKYSGTITKIGEDFEFKWNTTYTVTITEGGGEFYKCQVNTESFAILTLTSSTDCTIDYTAEMNTSDLNGVTICVLDKNGEMIDSKPIDEKVMIGKFEGLRGLYTYTVTIELDEEVMVSYEITTKGTDTAVTGSASADGKAVKYQYTVSGNSDEPYLEITQGSTLVYTKKLSIGENSGTVSDEIEYGKEYVVAVVGDLTSNPYVSNTITIESFANVNTSVVSSTVVTAIEFKATVASGAAVGIYSDPECLTVINTAESVTSPMIYSYELSEAQQYYLGIRDGNGGLISTPVSASSTDQFKVSDDGTKIHYSLAEGAVAFTKAYIKDDAGSQSPDLDPYEGDYTDWTFNNTYHLWVTAKIDSITKDIKVMDLDLTNPVHLNTYYFSQTGVKVIATINCPMTLYMCVNKTVVNSVIMNTNSTEHSASADFMYNVDNEFFVNKRGLISYAEVSSNYVLNEADDLPFAEINLPSEYEFKSFEMIDVPLYYQWDGQTTVTCGLYTDETCQNPFRQDCIVTPSSGDSNARPLYYFNDSDGGKHLYLGVLINGTAKIVSALDVPDKFGLTVKEVVNKNVTVQVDAYIKSTDNSYTIGLYDAFDGSLVGDTITVTSGTKTYTLPAKDLSFEYDYKVKIMKGDYEAASISVVVD